MREIKDLPLPDRILKAAFMTFADRGYDKASMDEVAAVAETTKRTVYAHFGSKEMMFRAAIGNAIALFLADLPEFDCNGDPEQELLKFAIQFSELSTWRTAILLQRVVIGESQRLPDLGEMLHRELIFAAERRIADYLASRFSFKDPSVAGEAHGRAVAMGRLFLNMTTGPQRFATLMEARPPAPNRPFVSASGADDAWIRFAVRCFLDALGCVATAKTGS